MLNIFSNVSLKVWYGDECDNSRQEAGMWRQAVMLLTESVVLKGVIHVCQRMADDHSH